MVQAAKARRRLGGSLPRLASAVGAGVLAVLLSPSHIEWWVRAIAGYDAGALLLLVVQWTHILRASAEETRTRAAREDPGRASAWFVVLSASFVSLFASLVILRQALSYAKDEALVWSALALAAIALSWFLTHTEYTLRYAHIYYREARARGLTFPGDEAPKSLDFAYFAFTIGMCFQVSDVAVTSAVMRRVALAHALIAYAYNTTIVALTINLVSGLVGH